MEDPATSSSITSLWTSINSWFTSTVFFILLNLMIATILFISNLPSSNNHQSNKERDQQEQQDHQNQNPQDRPKFARSPSILHRLKSFNFYPERPEQELFPETHHQLQALEVAATQYVFNQPLNYEHFDLDIHPTRDEVGRSDFETRVIETETNHFDDSDPTHREIRRDSDTEVFYQEDDEEEVVVEEEEMDEFESLDEVYSRLTGGGTHVDRSQSDGAISSKPAPPPAKAKKSMRKSASLKVGFSHFEEEKIVEARRPETMREKKSAVRMMAEEDHDDVEVDSKAADFINKFKNDLILQRIESIAARSK
ncbi:hypothetical protein OSB04_030122 [Centaurea solstitialis]|uniref:DUF4408 domain-containing protein n=1 Tax=Centaurea solstitialis TaxID=347529 RepID=A0AA38S695_9ASTR|nr:hypothetical protein OSB04_030122 [Centaurea solstitialis]